MTTDSLRYSLAALVIAVTGSMATAAAAQQARCAPREEVLQHLAKTYLEQPAAEAVTQQGALMEVLTSASGTWTALISIPELAQQHIQVVACDLSVLVNVVLSQE